MNKAPATPKSIHRSGKGYALAMAAGLYVMVAGCSKAPDLKALATGPMAKLVVPSKPLPAPTDSFTGPDGKAIHLADLKGQVVVLNFWATWCGPCVEEMPSLAKLQQDYAGKGLKVVAVSVDSEGEIQKAKAFLQSHGGLPLYNDPGMHMVFDMKPRADGIPTTVVYGKDGLERARLSGGADWSTDQAKKVMDAVLAEKG